MVLVFFFRQNNNDKLVLRDEGGYNILDLRPPSSSGQCKIRLKRGNGNYWDILGINDD